MRLAVRALLDQVETAGERVEPWTVEAGGHHVAVGAGSVPTATSDAPGWRDRRRDTVLEEALDAIRYGRPHCVRDDFATDPWVEGVPWGLDTARLVGDRLGLIALVDERTGHQPRVVAVGGWAPRVRTLAQARLASATLVKSGLGCNDVSGMRLAFAA